MPMRVWTDLHLDSVSGQRLMQLAGCRRQVELTDLLQSGSNSHFVEGLLPPLG